MTKIDIYSGFLGAGKTTLIKKMIKEAYAGEKLVLIENEFGEIGIDGGFLQEAGIQITEMNSGCICCSLVGDFGRALEKVIADYAPDRILIEPSGVGKLSDVIAAVQKVTREGVELGNFVTVADATKCKMYMKNFGEFYNNQIETANTIVLSRTGGMNEAKLDQCVAMIREHNAAATLVTTPWEQLTGEQLMQAMEQRTSIADELAAMEKKRTSIIITITTRTVRATIPTAAATITMTMMMRMGTSTSTITTIITTTRTVRATIPTAAATIITMRARTNTSIITIITTATMPTRCSSAGVSRRTRSSPKRRSRTFWVSSPTSRPTASFCAPRATLQTAKPGAGFTLTTSPARAISVTAARWSRAACA